MNDEKQYEDIPSEFWSKWLDSDTEKRIAMLGTTLLVRELIEHLTLKFKDTKLPKTYIKELAARHFNDYLEDLENTLLAKNN